jgi:hypothetical protein
MEVAGAVPKGASEFRTDVSEMAPSKLRTRSCTRHTSRSRSMVEGIAPHRTSAVFRVISALASSHVHVVRSFWLGTSPP